MKIKNRLTAFTTMSILLSILFTLQVFAEPLVGGITINNGESKTTNQDANLTISAGNPTVTNKVQTTTADFNSGTLTKTVAAGNELKLDKFLDGGFESGNLNGWDNTNGWGVVTSPVKSGSYAAKSYGPQRFLTKKFDTPQKNGYLRLDARFTENNQFHYFIEPVGESSSWCAIAASSDGHFYYGNGGTWKKFPIDTTYVANQWYNVELYWFGDSSTYKIKINGMDITNGGIEAKDSYSYLVKSLRAITFSSGGDSSTIINPAGLILDNIFITTNITPEMEEGFETGDFSKWGSVGADWEIVSSPVYNGKKAAMASGDSNVLHKSFSQPQNNFYIRIRALFTETNMVHFPLFLYLKDGGYCHMAAASDNGHIQYYDFAGGGYKDFSTPISYQPNKWYQFEWLVKDGKYTLQVTGNGVNASVGGVTITDNFINSGTDFASMAIQNTAVSSTGGMSVDDILVLDLNKFPTSTYNVPTYAFSGTRTSPSIDLTSLGTAIDSKIDWTSIEPSGTAVTFETSLDGGSTWNAVPKGGVIPKVTTGTSLTGKSLLVRQKLSTTNMEVTPKLQDITITINGVKPDAGAVMMQIRNDQDFNDTDWVSYTTAKSWRLSSGDGEKTVYVKFKNGSGESDVYHDSILFQPEITLNEIYNQMQNMKTVFKVINGLNFSQMTYKLVGGKDKDNLVTATIVSVPDSEYRYSMITGKFDTPGPKALIINGELLLFQVIDAPKLEDIATVIFE